MSKQNLKENNILIIGLGMIGGSYAKGLNAAGIIPFGYDINLESMHYAIDNKIIQPCVDLNENLKKADLIILCLYPNDNILWLKENQKKLMSNTIITDVSGIKMHIIKEIKSFLREDIIFVSSHPMAGKETSGILVSDNKVFNDANYIIVPINEQLTDEEVKAIEIIKDLASALCFKNIEVLSAEAHDEIVSYLSQLTHVIAVSLMNAHNVEEMIRFTGDSFRDLTRIAKINEKLWSELFLLNKNQLIKDIDVFLNEIIDFKNKLINEDEEEIKCKLISSTEKRKLFDKNKKA